MDVHVADTHLVCYHLEDKEMDEFLTKAHSLSPSSGIKLFPSSPHYSPCATLIEFPSREKESEKEMASMAMTSPFLGSGMSLSKLPNTSNGRRSVMMTTTKASAASNVSEIKDNSPEKSSKRRDLVFAGAAAVMCSIAGVAMADEPKNGSPEAKKKYAPVCITMPTAKICKN